MSPPTVGGDWENVHDVPTRLPTSSRTSNHLGYKIGGNKEEKDPAERIRAKTSDDVEIREGPTNMGVISYRGGRESSIIPKE